VDERTRLLPLIRKCQCTTHAGLSRDPHAASHMQFTLCRQEMEKFLFSELNDIADNLWHSHWTEMGMSPTEPVQSMRSTMGDYSIDVLEAAVAKAGDKLLNITPTIRNFMQVYGIKWTLLNFNPSNTA